ncbi:MAG TPA: sialate O-acetylesterase [Chitinophagaceae bacterium]|nr:sialate O-acetylesterase [Chitinophagaceae bacterium]
MVEIILKELMQFLRIQVCFYVFFLLACNPEKSRELGGEQIVYDVFPVLGQSNAYNGFQLDAELDKPNELIFQLGRFGVNDLKIILAKEPLEHHIPAVDCNGFAMTFAKLYLQYFWQLNHRVLLIPCAENASSFRLNHWNKGDTLYNDAVNRLKYVLDKYPGSKVKAFLWHQGESDVYWGRNYAGMLDRMIMNMRRDIGVQNGDSIPFIVGGFVPFWADQRRDRRILDSVIKETPERVIGTGYADPRFPFVITKPDNKVDEIHFDAAGQREMGKRYFESYQKLN